MKFFPLSSVGRWPDSRQPPCGLHGGLLQCWVQPHPCQQQPSHHGPTSGCHAAARHPPGRLPLHAHLPLRHARSAAPSRHHSAPGWTAAAVCADVCRVLCGTLIQGLPRDILRDGCCAQHSGYCRCCCLCGCSGNSQQWSEVRCSSHSGIVLCAWCGLALLLQGFCYTNQLDMSWWFGFWMVLDLGVSVCDFSDFWSRCVWFWMICIRRYVWLWLQKNIQ